MTKSVVQALVDAMAARGVARIFGIPGGGSSLDVIEAAAGRGIDFVLTRTETAATLMAACTAELSGAPGIVITGVGPGAASAVNGMAHAHLDRAPVMLITDRFDDSQDWVTHQAIDQAGIFAPLVRASRSLRAGDGPGEIEALFDAMMAHPRGPALVELSAAQASRPAGEGRARPAAPAAVPDPAEVEKARSLLARSSRPVLVAGLQAPEEAAGLRALADALGCPVFATYKAKGCFPEDDPRSAGIFTGGESEAACMRAADLVILYGLDPVELIPQRWRFDSPVVEIGLVGGLAHYKVPDASLIGPLAASAALLHGANRPSSWGEGEAADFRARALAAADAPAKAGLSPQQVVRTVDAALPAATRMTVDAGAHMFPSMTWWTAREPRGALISNGLATMGFGIPAAVASALHEPDRPVVCFTGDGGIMMCVAELMTAAQRGLDILVVVLDDAALSLIDIKQQARAMPTRGVRYAPADIARIAEGMGCLAWAAEDEEGLQAALAQAAAAKGTRLIDVRVDPSVYPAMMKALRG